MNLYKPRAYIQDLMVYIYNEEIFEKISVYPIKFFLFIYLSSKMGCEKYIFMKDLAPKVLALKFS